MRRLDNTCQQRLRTLCLPAFGDIAKDQNGSDGVSFDVFDERTAIVDLYFRPIFMYQKSMVRQTKDNAFTNRIKGGVLNFLICQLVSDLENFTNFMTYSFVTPSSKSLRDWIEKCDYAGTVGADHSIADARQGDSQNFTLLAEGLLSLCHISN